MPNPVMGVMTCPHCNRDTPVFWNGNIKNMCVRCNKKFIAKRQKLRQVQAVKYKGGD